MFQTVIIALNEGFLKTLEIFCVTLLGALPLGLIIAFGSMSRWKPLKWFVKTLVWVVRGTPLMLQLWFFYFFFPFSWIDSAVCTAYCIQFP